MDNHMNTRLYCCSVHMSRLSSSCILENCAWGIQTYLNQHETHVGAKPCTPHSIGTEADRCWIDVEGQKDGIA